MFIQVILPNIINKCSKQSSNLSNLKIAFEDGAEQFSQKLNNLKIITRFSKFEDWLKTYLDRTFKEEQNYEAHLLVMRKCMFSYTK